MKDALNDFLTGFKYPFKSFGYFRVPRILYMSIIPALINILIYAAIFIFTYRYIISLSGTLSGFNQPDPGFFNYLIHISILVLSFFLLLFISYLAFVILGGIISAPFNEQISIKVEEMIKGQKFVNQNGFWKDAWLSIKAEVVKLAFYFAVIIPLFVIGFFPVVGAPVSTIFGFIFSAFYNALDFMDYPMTRDLFPLFKKIKVVKSKFMLSFGFGTAAFLILFLPVVNALLKPVLVISGTAIFFEKNYKV